MTDWRVGLDVLQLLAIVGIAWYSWKAKRESAQKREIAGIERRLMTVEDHQDAGPTKDDVHQLTVTIAELRGDLRVLCTRMEGMGNVVDRIETIVNRHEDHLLGAGGRP